MNLQSNNSSVFYTSLILSCCPELGNKHLDFILTQKSSRWSWNYHERGSECYPDDLDDTFIALSALYTHAPNLIDEEAMVAIVQLLIKNEVRPGGPYYTWDIPHTDNPNWDDVDLVVNSNIMNFCMQMQISLPSLFDWIEEHIKNESLESKYYKSSIVVIYFLSKWYQGSHCELLIEKLLSEPWNNPMETALAISACLRLGLEPAPLAEKVGALAHYAEHGEMQAFPFFVERVTNEGIIWSGSKAFTTACIAEALSLYRKKTELAESTTQDYQNITSQIVVRALALAPVSKYITAFQKNSLLDSIALLPFLFYEHSKSISLDQALDLGVANLLGWIGYTMYDDILDGDALYSNIPLANICTREASRIFNRFTSDGFVHEILNGIDLANQWEYTHCKCSIIGTITALPETLPDYGDYSILAEKSLGHALGPMIIAGPQIKDFFVHYLIARQLNDDAHDWFSDLEKGFLNPVSMLILSLWRKDHTQKEIDLVVHKESLQKLFWNEVIDDVVEMVTSHIRAARAIGAPYPFLETLLTPLEQSAKRALAERDSAKRFLELYQ